MTNLQSEFKHLMAACLMMGVCVAMGLPSASADASDDLNGLDIRPEDKADVCDPDIPQIRVDVFGVEPEGILLVELYGDDTDHFLEREGRLRRTRVPASTSPQRVCINIDAPGTYAVASYHDQDGDRKLDKKWNRLPAEPFALSTNPKLKLRKPRLNEAAFEAGVLGADIELQLRD
ncbi:MAG: DUF2141 domain-containing protein [Pseudomonadota bacterium]